MARHPGPREARPEYKLRAGHPVGHKAVAVQNGISTHLHDLSWYHLGGPHSRAMTSGDVVQKKLTGSTSTATRTEAGIFTVASHALR